jgi:hypothetical protein
VGNAQPDSRRRSEFGPDSRWYRRHAGPRRPAFTRQHGLSSRRG